MQQMTIKIIANFLHEGKRVEMAEEVNHLIKDPPQKKDTVKLSNVIKKLFEKELGRIVAVKLRIHKEALTAIVNVRPAFTEDI